MNKVIVGSTGGSYSINLTTLNLKLLHIGKCVKFASYTFVWQDFLHYSYMHASSANLKALCCIQLRVEALVSAIAWR